MTEKSRCKEYIRFLLRFAVTHTVTYLVFGLFFMFVSDYFLAFTQDPIFDAVMKPADALSIRMAPLVQLLRGALLATAVYPFRLIILQSRFGWLKLFWLLFVFTAVGAVITGPGSIEGYLYTRFTFDPFFGYPEIALQMLAFSWLWVKWETQSSHGVQF